MPEVLQLAHFVEQHSMAKMQVRRSRIKTGFNPQRFPGLEFLLQFLFDQQLIAAAFDDLQGMRCRAHSSPSLVVLRKILWDRFAITWFFVTLRGLQVFNKTDDRH
jgi:hypothetical protein